MLPARRAQPPPLYEFIAPDGITHTLWKAGETGPIATIFAGLRWCYIADGHHRAASASRARTEMRHLDHKDAPRALPSEAAPPPEEADSFLTVLFPSTQLRILPYHRA